MKLPFLLFFFLGLISVHTAQGQQYNFRNYNVEDGLAQSQVYALFQDKMGQIWMGTRGGGISIYNGFDFRTISDKDGLTSNYINDIEQDSDGRIWIATNKGLSVYNGTQFESLKIGSGTNSDQVSDICITSDNTVLFATGNGVYKLSDTGHGLQFIKIHKSDINASSVCESEGTSLWIGTNAGLLHYSNGELKEMSAESHYMRNSITRLQKDRKGNLWIGTYGDGVYSYNGSEFYRIDYNYELYKQTILDIFIDNSDNLWLATLTGGIVHFDRSSRVFTFITEQEGLSNNHTRRILQDLNGNYWFGTSGGGVCHFLGKQFTYFDERSGLGGNFIYSIFRDSKGQLWVGNSQKGISLIYSDTVAQFNASNGFANVKVKSIAEDKQGKIWLGTDGNGVFVLENGEFNEIEELKRTYIKQIRADKSGNVWIATAGNGLIKISSTARNYVVEKWTTTEGLLSNRLTCLQFDNSNDLWYGTENDGIACLSFRKKRKENITSAQGLPSNQIRSLVFDKQGKLWVGTAGAGICSITFDKYKTNIRQINTAKGLVSDNIYLLTVDAENNVIAGSEKGLDYLYLNSDGSLKHIKHYGKNDGFTGVETCQNAVWNDKNGTIWFGTINGLCRFNPAELAVNKNAPVLSFIDVKLFYESILKKFEGIIADGKQLNIPTFKYDQNHITFDFIGVNLKRPDEVLYRWKLLGFDENWSPPSKDRSILYSNLNPGKYTFLLEAANEDGLWTEKPLKFSFEVETPYWRSNWFIWLTALSVLIVLLLVYVVMLNRIRKKSQQKQKQIELDKQLLELEQKALRLQMNPHFIFNALNSIQSLIGTGQEKDARYFLAKFSRLMRQILDNSRKSEITLQEEIETIENYLLVEKFANGNRFNYEVNIDPKLESDFIKIPPMLLQPFIENAIKHGISGKDKDDRSGKITIRFIEDKGKLECIIEDNGIGRVQSAEMRSHSKETYHESMSLQVTRERLEMYGPDLGFNTLEIHDLYDKSGEAEGTRVIIRIPIE